MGWLSDKELSFDRCFAPLHDRHAGEVAFVLCPGPSFNAVPRQFYAGRLTLGVNRVVQAFWPQYHLQDGAYTKELEEAAPAGTVKLGACGGLDPGAGDYVFLPEPGWWHDGVHLSRNWLTVQSAINLAWYMGCVGAVIVGNDLGSPDGRLYAVEGNHNEVDWRDEKARSVLIRRVSFAAWVEEVVPRDFRLWHTSEYFESHTPRLIPLVIPEEAGSIG